MRQYIEELSVGQMWAWAMLIRGCLFMSYLHIIKPGNRRGGLRCDGSMSCFVLFGEEFLIPLKPGKLPAWWSDAGCQTRRAGRRLGAGSRVTRRSWQTCDENLINRGMSFDKEMVSILWRDLSCF